MKRLFRDPGMNATFEAYSRKISDNWSDLYSRDQGRGGEARFEVGPFPPNRLWRLHAVFWDGWHGVENTYQKLRATLGYAAWTAGVTARSKLP